MRPRRIVSLLAVSAIAALATPVFAGLIFFDDFSGDPVGTFDGQENRLAHWEIEQGPVDVLACDIDTGDGRNCLDLRAATIRTSQALIITIPGIYEIGFSVLGGLDPFAVFVEDAVFVRNLFRQEFTAYSPPLQFHSSITLAAMPILLTSVHLFQVITQTIHIGFQSLLDTSNGPLLTSVSFRHIAAVPEPSTLLLLGMGFIGLLAARLGRKAGEPRGA